MSAPDVATWMDQAGWSPRQLARAIVLIDGRGMGSGLESAIQSLRFGRPVVGAQAERVMAFIALWPAPGNYAAWEEQIALSAAARIVMRREAQLAKVEAVERARRDRAARLLAAERRFPAGRPGIAPLDGIAAEIAAIDGESIRALSGGTIGKAELLRTLGGAA